MKNSASLKQLSYFIFLLQEQCVINNVEDIAKFEKLEKIRIFELDKVQMSEYIEKLKGDRKWMEMITNQICGTA